MHWHTPRIPLSQVCSYLSSDDLARLALCSSASARAVRNFLRCGGDVAGELLVPCGAWSEQVSVASGRLLAAALRPVDGVRDLIDFYEELCGGEEGVYDERERAWRDDASCAIVCNSTVHAAEMAAATAWSSLAECAQFFLPELACACMWHTHSRARLLRQEMALSVLWVSRLARPRLAQIAPRDWVHRGYRVTGALTFFLSCFKWRIAGFDGVVADAVAAAAQHTARGNTTPPSPQRLESPPFAAGGHLWRLVLFPNATPRPGAAILGSAGPPGPGEGCISLFLERLSGHASDAGEEEDTGVQPPMRPVRAFFSMAVCHDAPLSSRVLCGHEDSERRKRYHVLSTCDGCGQYPLEERYKGTTMSDFDLCAKCYAKTCADARGKRGRSRSCSRSRSRSRSRSGRRSGGRKIFKFN